MRLTLHWMDTLEMWKCESVWLQLEEQAHWGICMCRWGRFMTLTLILPPKVCHEFSTSFCIFALALFCHRHIFPPSSHKVVFRLYSCQTKAHFWAGSGAAVGRSLHHSPWAFLFTIVWLLYPITQSASSQSTCTCEHMGYENARAWTDRTVLQRCLIPWVFSW